MDEYRQNAINHLKTHLDCVGYRDYLVTELQKLEKIEQIVNDWNNNWQESQRDLWMYLADIKEVIEQE